MYEYTKLSHRNSEHSARVIILKHIIDNSSPTTICTANVRSLVSGYVLSTLTVRGMAFLSIDRSILQHLPRIEVS